MLPSVEPRKQIGRPDLQAWLSSARFATRHLEGAT
jgi:hypothetical protein